MKVAKRLSRLGLACLLSLSSLLVVVVAPAHATPINCTWHYTGGGNNNFSDSGNWQNCNGGAPTGGGNEELVFPIQPGIILSANNDLSNASFLDITFTGGVAGDDGYIITGTGMSVGGITDQSVTQNGNEVTVDSLTLSGGSQINFTGNSSSQLIIGDPTNLGNNDFDVGTGNTLTLQLADTTIAANVIGDQTITTTSSDSGSVYLLTSSPNFTGTINAIDSTLSLDNNDGLSSGAAITVASGATLKGDGGNAPSITVNSGGIIAPGHSPGCLTAGSQLVINGTYQAEIAGTTACTDYDQITSGGTTDVTGATLDVSFLNGFTPAVGNAFTIIKNTGGGAVTGTFAGLPEGGTFKVGAITFAITYQGNGENDVVITVTGIDSAASAANAPGAPNTGLALLAAHPMVAFVASTMAALSITLVARRLNAAKQ